MRSDAAPNPRGTAMKGGAAAFPNGLLGLGATGTLDGEFGGPIEPREEGRRARRVVFVHERHRHPGLPGRRAAQDDAETDGDEQGPYEREEQARSHPEQQAQVLQRERHYGLHGVQSLS